MKKFISLFFIAIFCASHAYSLDKEDRIVSSFLVKNKWKVSENKRGFVSPAANIAPIHFFSKEARSPSCGLLIQTASELDFIEILMAEPDDLYPHCAGIKDAVSFKLGDKTYLLFVYTEKDTRDEIYDRFFFIYQAQNGGYSIDKQLNESNIPVNMTKKNSKPVGVNGVWYTATVDDGVRLAKATFARNTTQGLDFLDRDFISGRENSFSVFEDRKQRKCLFVVESGGVLSKFSSDLFSDGGRCIDFLASSKSKKGEKTFFIGIFEGEGKSRNIAIFSVAKDGSIRDERELALGMRNSGKTGDIKSAKAYLAEIAK